MFFALFLENCHGFLKSNNYKSPKINGGHPILQSDPQHTFPKCFGAVGNSKRPSQWKESMFMQSVWQKVDKCRDIWKIQANCTNCKTLHKVMVSSCTFKFPPVHKPLVHFLCFSHSPSECLNMFAHWCFHMQTQRSTKMKTFTPIQLAMVVG